MSKRKRRAKAKNALGFTPAIIEQANGRKRGLPGMGLGDHHNTSAMARPTTTKTKRELRRKMERKSKQRGWQDG